MTLWNRAPKSENTNKYDNLSAPLDKPKDEAYGLLVEVILDWMHKSLMSHYVK